MRGHGAAELAGDPRAITGRAGATRTNSTRSSVSGRPGVNPDDIIETLSAAGVIAGPINTVAEVVHDPEFLARACWWSISTNASAKTCWDPASFGTSESPGGVHCNRSARPGQHNDEVYGELLGLSAADIATLTEEGVL